MKIIQTYWNAKGEDFDQARCGWLTPETHWMAWALSCTLLRRFYDDVELYTTEKDAEIFRQFNIPYTKIHTSLDCDFIKNLEPSMWAYAKIYTYSLQEEPFLHVDGDVFIWEAFNQSLFSGDICVQNVEENLEVYHKSIETLLNTEGAFIPEWIYENKDYPIAFNMGIFGSNNIPFVKEYCNIAFEYYEKNKSLFSQMHKTDPNVNILPEQYLLYILSKKKNVSTSLLHNDSVKKDNDFSTFCNFTKIPKDHYFLHTLGGCKKNPIINEFITHCLSLENKCSYDKIRENISNNQFIKYDDIFFNNFIKNIKNKNGKSRSIITITLTNELKRLERIFNDFKSIKFSRCMQLKSFPFYNQASIDIQEYQKQFIGVNPNHKIARANYNFISIIKNDYILTTENTQPTILFLIRFYNTTGQCIKTLWLNPIELHFFETIKSGEYTMENLIKDLDNKSKDIIIKMIETMYNEELIFFCNSKEQLIKHKPSSAYSTWLHDYKTMIPRVLKYYFKINQININSDISSLNICGGSLYDMVNIMHNYNIQLRAYQCKSKIPASCNFPFISLIYIWQTISIYIIVLDITDKYIVFYNPISNIKEQLDKITFYAIWSGIIVT